MNNDETITSVHLRDNYKSGVRREEHFSFAGHEGKLGDDARSAGGELDAEQGAGAAAAAELLALLHLDVARAAAELEPRHFTVVHLL